MEANEDEFLPRDVFKEISSHVDGATLINLLMASKWITAEVRPVVLYITNRSYFREACHKGDILSIIRSKVALLKYEKTIRYNHWSYSKCPSLAEWMLEGFRIACIKGHLELAQFLYKINKGKYVSPPYYHGRKNKSIRIIQYYIIGFELACWKSRKDICKWLLELEGSSLYKLYPYYSRQ